MDLREDQGILDQLLKRRPGALPAFPVLAGCLLLLIWISFGMRILVYWTSGSSSQSRQFFLFLADPLAALVSGGLLVYLIKSSATRGGRLLGLLAIPIGLFFTAILSAGMPSLTPLLIFQLLLTYFMGWFGGSVASGQFAERLKYRQGLADPSRLTINRSSPRYRTLLGRLSGDEDAARRLINRERSRHPDHNSGQLIQDALDSLSRDRNRS